MKRIFWSSILFLSATAPLTAAEIEYAMRIDGISCPFCVATSAKAFKNMDGVSAVKADLENGVIKVCADADKVQFTDEKLNGLFTELGFNFLGFETSNQCSTH